MTPSGVVSFIIEESYHTERQREELTEVIEKHFQYGTIFTLQDILGIVAMVRWNKDDEVAHILDFVVRKDSRRKNLIKKMLLKGLIRHHVIKHLSWERIKKYPYRKQRKYSVGRILKRRK